MLLDASFLISLDRSDKRAKGYIEAAVRFEQDLATTQAVVAQVWRSGPRNALLARFLNSIPIYSLAEGRSVGEALGASRTTDVVDAHLVVLASSIGESILTGDVGDLSIIVQSLGLKVKLHQWPLE